MILKQFKSLWEPNNYEVWITFTHMNHPIPFYVDTKFGKRDYYLIFLHILKIIKAPSSTHRV
jgi:hypothetical protein